MAGDVSNAFLGVLIDTFDLGDRLGASVVGTVANSAAARIGLAAGDTITSFSGIGLTSADSLRDEISTHVPGEHVNVTWLTPHGTAHLACVQLSRVLCVPEVPTRRTRVRRTDVCEVRHVRTPQRE